MSWRKCIALQVVIVVLLVLASGRLAAAPVVTEISGVDGAKLANVRAHLSLVQAESLETISVWRLRQMAGDARGEVRDALKPFGHYRPRIEVQLIEADREGDPWRAVIRVDAGPPVTIARLDLQLLGEGAEDEELLRWRADWPLPIGSVLEHQVWESAWREAVNIAETRGYFAHRFTRRQVIVDPDSNQAEASLRLDTGRRYRFGQVAHDPLPFSERLINRLTVVEPGEPYSLQRVDHQREVLARSGLFDRIVVEEERERETGTVNLQYRLNPRPPNSYRATVGFGTDTGARLQLAWIRHYLSGRGNRLDTGFGVQQSDSEFVLRSEYLHPRGSNPSEFLTAGGLLRRQQDNFRFNDENRREAVFDSFSGSREQAELRLGRLQQRLFWRDRFQTVEERLFLAVLNESFDAFREARFSEENEALLAANPALEPFLQTQTNTLALGAEWRLPNIVGSGFFTTGQIVEARLLAAHNSLGSDVSFAQAYLRGRIHRIFGDRHKLMVSGEIGYTEAQVRELDLSLDDRFLALSITELPERYRFKTGGDRTVRGYAFETLSTNRNGANHIMSASVEYEFRVGENWSLATFFDIGNAFNDWNERKLKRGIGAGFRWYTLIGPIQVDVAQALDDADRPWRLHFTIGTRLL
ncbi:MAG: autotransporter assembly complex protein TamA [Wenzhouxiangella sp.]